MPRTTFLTKHFELTQLLRKRFATYRAGQEIPTVRELAETMGVAQGTIVKTLNSLREEGVIERPAGRMRLVVRELHHHVTKRVSVIRPSWPSPEYDAAARSIIAAGRKRDWGFELLNYESLSKVDLIRLTRINDAAVLMPNSEPFPDHLRAALRNPDKPVVVVNEIVDGLDAPSVTIDEKQSGRDAVAYLADQGHRKILAVMSEPPAGIVQARIAGWREVMQERSLVPDVEKYFVNCGCRPGMQSTDNAYQHLSRWIAKSKLDYTAIFFDAWTGALAGTRVLREMGLRVPEDISITAYAGAGSIAAYLAPALTATEADTEAYGEQVIAELEKMFSDSYIKNDIRVPPRLIVRDSVAPLI
ncbi:MAG: LacI family DNA-binding transcriptional regulator [Planctomycetota bacterium]